MATSEQRRWADYDDEEEELAEQPRPQAEAERSADEKPPTVLETQDDNDGFQEVGNKKRKKEPQPQQPLPAKRAGARGRAPGSGKKRDNQKGRGRWRNSGAPPRTKDSTARASKDPQVPVANGHAQPEAVKPAAATPVATSKPVTAGVSWASVLSTNLPPPQTTTTAPETSKSHPAAPAPAASASPQTPPSLPLPRQEAPKQPISVPLDTAKELLESFNSISISHAPVALVPRGLINRGNACFFNSVLQALISLPPFYHLFASLQTKRFSAPTPFIDACVRFVQHFDIAKDSKLPSTGPSANNSSAKERTQPSNSTPFYPEDIVPLLTAFNPKTPNSQEDAHEFLIFLLDRLHEELCAAVPDATKEAKAAEGDSTDKQKQDDEDEWVEVGRNNQAATVLKAAFRESPISQIFGCVLRSTLRRQGTRPSISLSPIYAVPLDIDIEGVSTLEEALASFMAPEHLDGVTVQTVEVRAKKQTTFDRLQPVLIFHLKRFAYSTKRGSTGTARKVAKPITFPKKLYLRPHALYRPGSTSGKEYILQAVVSHHGRLPTGGHYTCDAWYSGAGRWVHFDDTNVSYVSPKTVFDKVGDGYLLFYTATNAEQ